jgi:hypothetical protein
VSIEETIRRLKQARRLVSEIIEDTDIPQLQATLRHADLNLHWALWNLGDFEGLYPGLPE